MDQDKHALIPGWNDVLSWFEGHSSFHDAEILELHLDRMGKSYIRIHWWIIRPELDARGYYIMDKHAIVTLHLSGISDLDLLAFNFQNVIFGLQIQPTDEGLKLSLDPCHGLAGTITAKEITAEVAPGKPTPPVMP
ncbi:MAG TPA: Imm50 family immunity protein [Tepidisphaeraceae bacterium]|jgi:hypothetical protein|nr:Imm50 family immunity protein [Tepidisphaeraceae bacterium]